MFIWNVVANTNRGSGGSTPQLASKSISKLQFNGAADYSLGLFSTTFLVINILKASSGFSCQEIVRHATSLLNPPLSTLLFHSFSESSGLHIRRAGTEQKLFALNSAEICKNPLIIPPISLIFS